MIRSNTKRVMNLQYNTYKHEHDTYTTQTRRRHDSVRVDTTQYVLYITMIDTFKTYLSIIQ